MEVALKHLTALLLLLFPLALAQVDSMAMVDDKHAIHDRGWGTYPYEFAPKPDGSSEDYTVYALTRHPRFGVEMKPLGRDRRIANTAPQQVTLDSVRSRDVKVEYVSQQVAYLRVEQTVAVRDGSLWRNGVEVLRKNSDGTRNNLLWGAAWVGSLGLVGLFWIANTVETQVYTEAIPVTSGANPIEFRYGGGGNCLAFQPYQGVFWVNPSQLEPGRVYNLRTSVECSSGAGIVGRALVQTAPVRVEYQRLGLPPDARGSDNDPAPLQFAPLLASGQTVNQVSAPYQVSDGWIPANNLSLPFVYVPGQLDRLWSTRSIAGGGSEVDREVLDQPYDGRLIPVCTSVYYQGSKPVCAEWHNYRRIAADPPSGLQLPAPGMGQQISLVNTSVGTGPNGEKVEQLTVVPVPPQPQVVQITDTFQRVN